MNAFSNADILTDDLLIEVKGGEDLIVSDDIDGF